MVDVNEIVTLTRSNIGKEMSGFYDGRLINDALNYANEALFKVETGIDQLPEGAPGRYWQKTRKVTDALAPFIVTTGRNGIPYTQVDANGYAAFPSDFYLFSSMNFPILELVNGQLVETGTRVITDLTDEIFRSRIASHYKKPNDENIISTVSNGMMEFAPKNIKRVLFTYLRKPRKPYWDAVFENGRTVYYPPGSVKPNGQPSLSVDIEWPRMATMQDFYPQYLSFVSTSIKDQATSQASERIKITGQ